MSAPRSYAVSYRGGVPGALTVGETVVEPAFLSTSADVRVATGNFTEPAVVAVAGTTGRELGALSQEPSEREVVYPMGARLLVVADGEVDGLPVVVTVVQDGAPPPDHRELVAQVVAEVRAARELPPGPTPRRGRFSGPIGG